MSPCRSLIGALASMSLVTLLGCAAQENSVLESTQTRIEELERENAALVARIAALEGQLREAPAHGGVHWTHCVSLGQPTIDAVVLDVKEGLRIVVLDKGQRDGVKVGYVFDVYLGAQYKGQVRVQDVQETLCSGVIVHAMNPIARRDSATTSL